MGAGAPGFTFDVLGVLDHAPASAGIYALYIPDAAVVLVGETEDIQRRLLEHLSTPTACLKQHRPTMFAFELHATAYARRARHSALINLHQAPCS